MKTLFILLFAISQIEFLHAQSVSIRPLIAPTGDLIVEVGDTIKFVGSWTAGTGGEILLGYEWKAEHNDEHQHGASNINGTTNYDPGNDPIFRQHVASSDTISIIWGDHNDILSDFVSVRAKYYYTGSSIEYYTGWSQYLLYIYRIGVPDISTPHSIQECCTDNIPYCNESVIHDNDWDWTVTGGTQISGDGARCITVTPNTTGNMTITCTATRTTNTHGYSRTGSKIITRSQPETPPITGPNYVCKGQTITLCVDEICGLDETHWTDDYPDLNLMSGQGDLCAVFRPNNISTNGTVATIRALSQLVGECEALSSSWDVSIYDSGTPPTPNGNVTIFFEEGYDPCSDEENIYTILYDGTYANGIITVNPSIIIDVPHHHLNDDFYVEVCYHNLCGGGNTCRTYHLYLPAPCEDWPIFNPKPNEDIHIGTRSIKASNYNENVVQSDQVIIFPNPLNDVINIKGLNEPQVSIEIYNVDGTALMQDYVSATDIIQLSVSSIKNTGLYFLKIKSKNTEIYKKIIIQR